jgi:peroxiredoxin
MLLWAQNSKFVLKGKIGELNAPFKIYLVKSAAISPDNITDSAGLKDGSFEFNGQLDIARPIGLVIAADRSALNLQRGKSKAAAVAGPASVGARLVVPDSKFFYLDAGETVVSSADSLRHATVTGASEKANSEEAELQKCLEPIWSENGDIGQFQMNTPEETQKTEAFKKEFNEKVEAVDKKQAATVGKFITDHPNSPISLYALAGNMGSQATLPQIKELYAVLSPAIRNSAAGKSYAASIVRMEKTAIGSPAPDFVENDVNGKPISLKNYRGKYVLLDFWASWCGPCRQENPNVLKAWNKYKDKNFVVIGVSLDQTKDPWLAAIKKDGLPWTHISGLKGFDDPVARLYEVHAIPVNYLIDPDGKIIASSLRDVALDEKLASVLDK